MQAKLRIYLGAAPGVGKTYAMLNEGWRRRERGTDVVVGLVVHHGRPNTIAQIRDLEVVPPRRVEYRGTSWVEMDAEAIIRRRPDVVLVDELAHTNVPGSRHEKRWEDIDELLDAGIEVVSTVNIQHLESLNDVVNRITGITQRETVPDVVVRRADQIELVDMSPEALRRRMAHGNIYAADKLDAALGNYFRLGNLGALRELALLWVADRVEDSLQQYMDQQGITTPWETRERVLVALTGAPGGDQLVRRAARLAQRTAGDLVGINVVSSDGLARPRSDLIEKHQTLLRELGGTWHEVAGDDVASTVVSFARAQHATQIVLGTSRRSRVTELVKGSVINRVVRLADGIDVHVIATESPEERRTHHPFAPVRGHRARGLVRVAAIASIALLLLVQGSDVASFLAFVAAALVAVGALDAAGRRRAEALRLGGESDIVLSLADRLTDQNPPLVVVEEMQTTLRRRGVALLSTAPEGWRCEASAGDAVPTDPAEGESHVLRDGHVLVMSGPPLKAEEQRLTAAFLSYLDAVLASQRLQQDATAGHALARADELRNALLAAVSHDLRTPLASIKALTSGWLEPDVTWPTDATREFMTTIDGEADRLRKLVENLLDMSRLQTGALELARQPTGLDEVVAGALAGSSVASSECVVVDVPEQLPLVLVDPTLLERAIANLVDNAARHSGGRHAVRVEAASVLDRVDVRIIDRGCGIPVPDRERVFQPFQRLGDTATTDGVGLGLAVARGFVDAVGGELTIEDTPGGGVTMVVSLPIATSGQMEGVA